MKSRAFSPGTPGRHSLRPSGDCFAADLNCDRSVDALDLAILLGAWSA